MNHAQVHVGMIERIVRERPRHCLGAGHSEIIHGVPMRGMGKVRINHVFDEIRAVASHSVEMIFVWQRIEFGDDVEILLNCGRDNEDVHTSGHPGADHLPPFRFITLDTFFGFTVGAQNLFTIFIFQDAFDLLRAKNWPKSRVLNAVDVQTQRRNVPLKLLVFTQVDVIAEDRASFARTAEPKLYGRVRTNAREIDGGVAGAGNALHVGVQGFIENHSDVTIGSWTAEAKEQGCKNEEIRKLASLWHWTHHA